jgi:hypothetical protein
MNSSITSHMSFYPSKMRCYVKKNFTTCTMHAVSLSNLMDFTFLRKCSRNFCNIFSKIFANGNFRGHENFRETKFRKISRNCPIFSFSRKLKNAFSFQPYCRLCPIWNGIQRCPPVNKILQWKGSISIFNFHNVNEGAVDLHYVTGRSFAFSYLLSVPMSMISPLYPLRFSGFAIIAIIAKLWKPAQLSSVLLLCTLWPHSFCLVLEVLPWMVDEAVPGSGKPRCYSQKWPLLFGLSDSKVFFLFVRDQSCVV